MTCVLVRRSLFPEGTIRFEHVVYVVSFSVRSWFRLWAGWFAHLFLRLGPLSVDFRWFVSSCIFVRRWLSICWFVNQLVIFCLIRALFCWSFRWLVRYSKKYALRVPPAVTRLMVYRGLRVEEICVLKFLFFTLTHVLPAAGLEAILKWLIEHIPCVL